MEEHSKILIIDDEEAMRDSCRQVLEKDRHTVEEAKNGEIGMKKVDSFHPDLVLLDLKMPGLSGLEVLEHLTRTNPHLIVVVITGYATVESAVDAMKQGAYDYLPKPFTPDELRLIIRRGLERRRYILKTEKLEREKESMRKTFVSMVSHELRSPLAAVQQNLMVITGGMAGQISDKSREILLRMKDRIKGLIGLTTDWLDLSRIESGEMTTEMGQVDIPPVLVEVMDMLKTLADESEVSLESRMKDPFPHVHGNRETIQMLFTNLIHNGIKYNRRGGKVTIILEKSGREAKIQVQDTGVGIPEDKILLIFEQFYRTKEKQGVVGSGLGLSIAQKIVEAHKGRLEVTSRVGKGTTFTVYLPLSDETDVKIGQTGARER
jgi:signal transduction histidine kinase